MPFGNASAGPSIFFASAGATGNVTISNNNMTLDAVDAVGIQSIYQSTGTTSVFGGDVAMTGNTFNGTIPGVGAPIFWQRTVAPGALTVDNNVITTDQDTTSSGSIVVADFACFGGPCDGIDNASINGNTITTQGSGFSAPGNITAFAETAQISGNVVSQSNGSGGVYDGAIGINALPIVSGTGVYEIFDNIVSGSAVAGIATLAILDSFTVAADIYNNVVYNTEGADAAGISIGSSTLAGGAPQDITFVANIINNTVVDNTAGGGSIAEAAGIHIRADDTNGGTDDFDIVLFNNLVQENANGIFVNPVTGPEDVVVTADYNLVSGNTIDGGSDYVGLSAGANDVSVLALLKDQAGGDLSLQGASSALDTGVATLSSVNAPATDIDGVARPQRTVFDLGAYEYMNQAPVANAGSNQSVTAGAEVALTCAATSDPEDDTVTYAWLQTSGPTVSLSDNAAAEPTFTPSEAGTYIFECTATDAFSAASTSSVTITAVSSTSGSSGSGSGTTGTSGVTGSSGSTGSTAAGTLAPAGLPLAATAGVSLVSSLLGVAAIKRRRG